MGSRKTNDKKTKTTTSVKGWDVDQQAEEDLQFEAAGQNAWL